MTKTFAQWMLEVDQAIAALCDGMTTADLPDCCYGDWYDQRVSPKAAAKRAIREISG